MRKIYCENCGSEQLEERGGTYVCKHCHAVWQKHEVDEVYDKLASILDEQKQERVANLRSRLYDELNAENIDSEEIVRLCSELRGYLPEDFQAKFFYIANKSGVQSISQTLRNVNPALHMGYVPQILDFMLRSLQTGLLAAVNDFLERAYGNNRNAKMYEHYNEILREEAQKVEASVYDPSIPRDVFVAYSSADRRKLLELVDALEKEGLSCFVALRNLQHGMGATVNYERNLRLAMDSCKAVVFVSSVKSRTDSDAYRIELPYVKKRDLENCPPQYRNNYDKLPIEYKKPRVEYIIEEYAGKAAEKFTREFFNGFERLYSPGQIVEAVYALKDRVILEDEPKKDVKYCMSCGAECAKNAKFCSECGSKEFAESYEEYKAGQARKQDDKLAELQAQLEAAKQAMLAAEEARKEAEQKAKAAAEEATKRAAEEFKAEAERKAKEEAERKAKEEAEAASKASAASKSATSKSTSGKSSTSKTSSSKSSSSKSKPSEKAEAAKTTIVRKSDEELFKFGQYPQSKVTDSILIAALNQLAGSTPSASDSAGWTDYKYYIEEKVQSFMWYKDVNFDGEKYRAVYFDNWRPFETSANKKFYQRVNGYKLKTVYWFKWEPIRWRILSKNGAEMMLLSDMLLDSRHYYWALHDRDAKGQPMDSGYGYDDYLELMMEDIKRIYPSNYEHSDIRAWLNDDFLNAAFSEQEKKRIKTTTVLNYEKSNLYSCPKTSDKIYLPSYKEVTNSSYGFKTDDDRKLVTTDYAMAQGAYADASCGNTGYCMERTPDIIGGKRIYNVGPDGWPSKDNFVNSTFMGVAPVMNIKI